METHHQPPLSDESLPRQVLRAIERYALDQPQGSGVLVFLPGLADIERCRQTLAAAASLQNWRSRRCMVNVYSNRSSASSAAIPGRQHHPGERHRRKLLTIDSSAGD